jgi:hypothetical protein
MIKRLSISLLLMGLAAFSLGAAAFAWFSDSGSADISITAGDVNLQFRVDLDCDGGPLGGYDTEFEEYNPAAALLTWEGIVPGDTTADCIEVLNNGDGELTVYALHSNFGGENAVRNATRWQYNAIGTGAVNCAFSLPQDAQYTSGRGCLLDTIGEDETFVLRVDVEFLDNGSDQNALQAMGFSLTSTLTGYTG